MLASMLAVMTWKMAMYVVVLLGLVARMGHWKKLYAAECLVAADLAEQKKSLEASLVTMGVQVNEWHEKASQAAAKVIAAQTESARLRADADHRAIAVLQQADPKDPIEFLRQEAVK